MEASTAINEGRQAFRDGTSLTNCPYGHSSPASDFENWRKGWELENSKSSKVFITGYSNATREGVTLHFSGKTSIQSRGLKSDSWFVSWDKIGMALCGAEYRRDD